jgi:hypothetical protein
MFTNEMRKKIEENERRAREEKWKRIKKENPKITREEYERK